MDGMDVAWSGALTDADAVSPAAASAFQQMLAGSDADAWHTPGVPPAAAFLAPPAGAAAALPEAAGAGEAGGVAAWLAGGAARLAGGAAAAGAILLTPTNTQRTTGTGAVDGHPGLGARTTRAPGDLSGQVTIFARGADGQPSRDLTTLAMDSQGRLTAPGGDGTELGRRSTGGSVSLAPGVADALDARAGVQPRPDTGGAGGRVPPGASAIRPDGECDEDGNVGDLSPRSRLPTNGTWTGEAGNSGWKSDDPDVLAITKGEPIQFRDGRPDFTPWSRLSANFRPGALTGNSTADRRTTLQALDASNNPDIQAAGSAQDYLDQNRLTAHHATDTCMQLVPKILNDRIAHIGGAADLRYQGGAGRAP